MDKKEQEQQRSTRQEKSIRRVLCAEDNPAIRQLLFDTLSGAGYQVELAADGMEALTKAVEWISRFDLLITDHRMPRLDGLSLVRHLRDVDFPGRILVLAGTLGDRAAELYGRFHIDGVVHKPIHITELLGVVDDLAAKPLPSYSERHGGTS
jgi:two-component system chemotaxis response regulator CheY